MKGRFYRGEKKMLKEMRSFLFSFSELKRIGAYLVKKLGSDLVYSLDYSEEEVGLVEVFQIEGNYFLVKHWNNILEGKRISKKEALKLARR